MFDSVCSKCKYFFHKHTVKWNFDLCRYCKVNKHVLSLRRRKTDATAKKEKKTKLRSRIVSASYTTKCNETEEVTSKKNLITHKRLFNARRRN